MYIADSNLLMIKSIIATYLNNRLETPNGKLTVTVDRILKKIKLPKNVEGDGSISDISQALKATIDWLIEQGAKEIPAEDLVARLKLNCVHESDYISIVEKSLIVPDDPEAHQRSVVSKTNELVHEYNRMRYADLFRDANKKVNFSPDEFDLKEYAREFEELLREVAVDGSQEDHEGFAGLLNTEAIESVEEVFEKSKTLVSEEGVMKTGMQGLNDGLNVGGLQAGFMYCFPALSHNYKTGMLLDLSRQVPLYNKPHLEDESKKGLVIRFSFENKLEQDLPQIYKAMREAEEQREIDVRDIDTKEATEYVINKLTANGWAFVMECYDPNNFDVHDLIARLQYWESQGYEVKLAVVDYLELITRANKMLRKDQAITYGYEVLRNHCFPRGIAVATAHQLSSDAQRLAREGTADFVGKVAGGGFYQNCQSLHNKLDCEVVMHIHKQGDESYLTFAIGKLRGSSGLDPKRTRWAYKFQQYGGIVDDVNDLKSKALYSIPGSGVSAGGMSAMSDADEMW